MGLGSLAFSTRTRFAVVTGLATTLAALTACAAPAQPTPPPGQAATLSPNVFSYDNIEFRTNRTNLLTPNNECGKISDAVIGKIGITPPQYSQVRSQANPALSAGCDLMDATYSSTFNIAASEVPFSQYWIARVPGEHDPGNTKTGVLSFRRTIIKDRYYAVTYLAGYRTGGANSGECVTAVDTGTPNPLVVTRKAVMNDGPHGDGGNDIPLTEVVTQQCAKTRQAAEILLDDQDKSGGSRTF